MKNVVTIIALSLLSVSIVSCGSDKSDTNKELEKKNAELSKLRDEQKQVNDKIAALELEIEKLDTSLASRKAKLVRIESIDTSAFSHFIDLQGRIDAQNVVMVSPRGAGGVVRQVAVKEGQRVSKGQLILRLDNALAQQQVDAAAAQIPGIESQLKLAQSVYERQMNLWKNNIGTEVQVLQAKTNAETVEAQLQAAKASLQLARENAALANVYAEISGVVDIVNVKVGEFFSPQSASMPASGIRLVNTGNLRVKVQVPETYLGLVKVGTNTKVVLPELNNKSFNAKVAVVSSLLDATSRTFAVEISIPQDKDLRPNQMAKVQLMDYSNAQAITVPINTLQSDQTGKYVLLAVKEGDKLYARKQEVQMGKLYDTRVEIVSGLKGGEQIIVEGFQSLYDGQLITTGNL